MDTVGFLEVTSIAAGVEMTDAMLKASNVKLIFSRASCPGKFYILITGDVSGVETSVKQGISHGKGCVVKSTVIPKVHKQVIQNINVGAVPTNAAAVGVIEYYCVTSSIVAADVAVKAANVELVDIRLGTAIGGKGFIVLTGELSAVKTAVNAAVSHTKDEGMLVNYTVVSNPKPEVLESLL